MFNKISFMWIPTDLYIYKALVAGHAHTNIYLYDFLKKNLRMHSFLDMGLLIFSKLVMFLQVLVIFLHFTGTNCISIYTFFKLDFDDD